MTATVYKFFNSDMTTYGGYQWEVGEWRETSGEGELCGEGWLHAYDDLLVGVMMNPIHGNFDLSKAVAYRCEAEGERKEDNGLKVGYTRLRPVERIDIPAVSLSQRVAFGILVSLEVYHEEKYIAWAKAWLSGEDRGEAAARAAAWAAAWAARARIDLPALAMQTMEVTQ